MHDAALYVRRTMTEEHSTCWEPPEQRSSAAGPAAAAGEWSRHGEASFVPRRRNNLAHHAILTPHAEHGT